MALRLVIALCAATAGCQATIGDPVASQAAGADAGSDPDAVTAAVDGSPVLPPAADADVPVSAPDAAPVTPEEECTARFGDVPAFVLCAASADTCAFVALNGDVSCGVHCAGGGGACVAAVDNDVGSCTDLESNPDATCATTGKIDLLCTCALPGD